MVPQRTGRSLLMNRVEPGQHASSEGSYRCWARCGSHVRAWNASSGQWRAWEMFAQFKWIQVHGAQVVVAGGELVQRPVGQHSMWSNNTEKTRRPWENGIPTCRLGWLV